MNHYFIPKNEKDDGTIYVTNGRNTGDNGTGALTAQDQQAARSLANTYIVILDDASVYEAISDRLIEDFKMEDLKKFFTTRIDDEGKEYIPNAQIKKLINEYGTKRSKKKDEQETINRLMSAYLPTSMYIADEVMTCKE